MRVEMEMDVFGSGALALGIGLASAVIRMPYSGFGWAHSLALCGSVFMMVRHVDKTR